MSHLAQYLAHMDALRAARASSNEPEEDRILDAMDIVWGRLTPEERLAAEAHAPRAFPGATFSG